MTTLQNAFDTLIEEQEALRAKFQEQAQGLFKGVTKEFFDQNPEIKAILWTQYTPYFNDGETCEFSVGEPTFTNAEGDELENVTVYGEYEGEEEGIWVYEGWGEAPNVVNTKNTSAFAAMIQSSALEDVMQAMFGDHVQVTATKDGFDVSDYDHD